MLIKVPLHKNHAMKIDGGVELYHRAFLTSAIDIASRSDRYTPVECSPNIHRIRGWVKPYRPRHSTFTSEPLAMRFSQRCKCGSWPSGFLYFVVL
jgi:hypothetical protein